MWHHAVAAPLNDVVDVPVIHGFVGTSRVVRHTFELDAYRALTVALLTMVVAVLYLPVDPWIRATVPHQTASGAFMQLRSADKARLVAVSSPVAASVTR